jgi:hypothetical protein
VNKGNTFSFDVTIGGCTAVIQSGKETRSALAMAYNNRGVAYRAKGEGDRAIADFNKAIELNPKPR